MGGHTVASRMRQSVSCGRSARILSILGPTLDSLLEASRQGGWSQGFATLQPSRVASAPAHSGEASSSGPTPLATQGPYNAQVERLF